MTHTCACSRPETCHPTCVVSGNLHHIFCPHCVLKLWRETKGKRNFPKNEVRKLIRNLTLDKIGVPSIPGYLHVKEEVEYCSQSCYECSHTCGYCKKITHETWVPATDERWEMQNHICIAAAHPTLTPEEEKKFFKFLRKIVYKFFIFYEL